MRCSQSKVGSEARIDRVPHGHEGLGVFHAGTTDWVAWLSEGCAFTCKITANVIEGYLMESIPEEREWKTAYETPKGAGNLAMEGSTTTRM